MKNLAKLTTLLLFVFLFSNSAKAQEERYKIVMSVNQSGKTITADLGTVSYGITRYAYYAAPAATDKKETPERGSYYLTLTVNDVTPDLLKLMAKKDTRFNGTITITDTFGKGPAREIKFTNAALDSYSDQYTTFSYDDGYAVATVTLSCSTFTINGVTME